MSVYMTEEEQLERIKRWWNKYSNLITAILSLFLVVVAGYKYWTWHQYRVSTQASNSYEHLMLAFSNQDNKGIRSYANQLIDDSPHTVYADAARLTLAKLYVNQGNYKKARKILEAVAKSSKIVPLQQVAKLRIARLFAAEKGYDQALNTLSSVTDKAYLPLINELKGDIFAATGKYQLAMQSYQEAITGVRVKGLGNLFLEMKTQELAALTQSTSNGENLKAA